MFEKYFNSFGKSLESVLLVLTTFLIGSVAAAKTDLIYMSSGKIDPTLVLIARDKELFRNFLELKHQVSISDNDLVNFLNDSELNAYRQQIKDSRARDGSPGPNCAC